MLWYGYALPTLLLDWGAYQEQKEFHVDKHVRKLNYVHERFELRLGWLLRGKEFFLLKIATELAAC